MDKLTGNISTVAGTTQGFSGDGGSANSAQLYTPFDVAVDSIGNLYIADSSNFRIRKVTFSTLTTAIPDTGQTKCYNDTVEIPCPSPGQDYYGQDGNYTINPPSYTKLDANRNVLPDSATSWAMVKDNVTGLIWENKTSDGSIHDANNQYTWVDAQNVFIAQLNASKFGGYNDWRLPTREELRSIVDYSRSNPSTDIGYFLKTALGYYWTFSTSAKDTSYAWVIDFTNGNDNSKVSIYYNSLYVRAVRGGDIRSLDNLVINNDETLTDKSTGLIWQQTTGNNSQLMTWKQALAYCENLTLANYMDWRLPNIKELASSVDWSRYTPAIDPKFMDTKSAHYWSSSTHTSDTQIARSVYFDDGYGSGNYKSANSYTRCVRGGQIQLPSPTITAVNPNTGTTAGGTTVTITGTNFIAGSTSVSFGGSSATVSSVSVTQIICTTPAHAAGAVDVKVTVMGAAAPTIMVNGFTYIPPSCDAAPVIVSPTGAATTVNVDTTVVFIGTGNNPTWKFSDMSGTRTGSTVAYTFIAPGTYTVTLTASGTDGCTKSVSTIITVQPVSVAILTINDALAIQGKSNAAVTVALNNPGIAVSSMQFDILYNATAGIHANGSYNLSSRTTGFTASVTPSENGANSKVTVILYKLSGSIPAGSGAIIDILFNVDSSAAVGTSTLSLSNCVLSDISANRITSDCTDTAVFKVEPSCSSTLGDINKDGSINILDLQVLINCIMSRGACNCCDLNNEGNYNIFDLQLLINKIISAVSTRSKRDNGNNTLTLPVIQTSKSGTGSFGLGLNNQSAVASGEFVFTYDSTTGFSISDVRLTSRTDGFSTDMTSDTADPKNVKVKVLLYTTVKTKPSLRAAEIFLLSLI